jgi:fumarylacetoacetase
MEDLFRDGRELALQLRAEAVAQFVDSQGIPLAQARLALPFAPRNFVDFYSSREHATNVGKRFRDPANPLPENWLHLPAAYNGRASNLQPPSLPVQRPAGQYKIASGEVVFAPTQELDYEMEIGYYLCPAAPGGIAGYVLLNDWSARDIQRWEYVPLGPFLGKAFATTVSPFLILPEDLEPFRVPGPPQVPTPLPYLQVAEPRNLDIQLEAIRIAPNGERETLTTTNYRHMYWSAAQQIVHLQSSGATLCLGDLHGSGTISGPCPGEEGSLLERGGPFLNDGDRLVFRGFAERNGYRVDFGEMEMLIAPSAAC